MQYRSVLKGLSHRRLKGTFPVVFEGNRRKPKQGSGKTHSFPALYGPEKMQVLVDA